MFHRYAISPIGYYILGRLTMSRNLSELTLFHLRNIPIYWTHPQIDMQYIP